MRLFVAVDLPATVKDELDHAVDALRPALPDAKWVPRDNVHLTVSFLGEVGDERVDGIGAALREGVAGTAPFAVRLAGSGAFPSPRRARVLWAGLEAADDRLASVAKRMRPSTRAARLPRSRGRGPRTSPWLGSGQPGDVSRVLPFALEPDDVPRSERSPCSAPGWASGAALRGDGRDPIRGMSVAREALRVLPRRDPAPSPG